jgi:hypothetical protein
MFRARLSTVQLEELLVIGELVLQQTMDKKAIFTARFARATEDVEKSRC